VSARPSRRRSEPYARVLIIALAAAVLFALIPFLSGFVGAAVLAVVVRPAHERLSPRIGRRPAAIVASLGAFLLILVPGVALAASLAAQAPAVARAVAQSTLLQQLSTLQIAGFDIGGIADAGVNELASWLSRQAVALVNSLTLAALNIVIAMFGLYYLLVTDRHARGTLARYLPFSESTIELLGTRFRTTTESMLIGIVLTALSQGVVVGGAFALVGLPGAGFWGFVTACASILPILGSSLVWFPGVLVLVADHRYGAAVTLGIIGVAIASQIDNLIRPVVYRRVSRIHPMVTLVGAFAGVRVLGLAGLLLGPLGISYLIELVKAYSLEYGTWTAPRVAAEASAAD
jgi:predicted PurR-regulated permease PerM